MDLYQMQIKNSWIACSLLAGFVLQLFRNNMNGISSFLAGGTLPVLLLGSLFWFRMLGPGDIKLFCALGGIMGPTVVCKCIWYAFLSGAGISLAVLISSGEAGNRIQYLTGYINAYIRTGKKKPYYRKGTAVENIHFTVPVFMSVMLYAGGIY